MGSPYLYTPWFINWLRDNMADNCLIPYLMHKRILDAKEEDEMMLEVAGIAFSKTKRPRINNFVEETVPLYPLDNFKAHFRLRRSTFEELMGLIAPLLHPESTRGRPSSSIEKQLLVVLWVLATPDPYRSIGDRFNFSRSSVFDTLTRVVKILNKVSSRFIQWPAGDKMKSVVEGFRAIAGFPGVAGAIDGTHIAIKAPTENHECYYNRKKFYSIVLLAICDDQMLFTDCFCGYPGSVHDARIYRNSDIKRKFDENLRNYFYEDTHLIGDAAFPLHKTMMVPFRDNAHLSMAQKNYNTKLSKTRCVVERAFSMLKGRFRRLKYIELTRVKFIPYIILSCCVLHNICIKNEDLIELEEATPLDSFYVGEDVQIDKDAITKRYNLVNSLL